VNRIELTDKLKASGPFLVLAPLAEITHPAFRKLIDRQGGCDLFFTEMISSSAHLKGGPLEPWYIDPSPEPGRLIYQLVGSDPDEIVRAALSLSRQKPAGIDINMGCSAPEIMKKGGGCAWMRKPEAAVRLVASVRDVLPGDVSLSVKMRLGEEEKPEELLRFGLALEKAGADFLTLHPKTRKEKHSRPTRWEHVKTLRSALTIPVIGNGHITDYPIARKRMDETGCHGLMLGRQAVREPWIFKRISMDFSGRRESFTVDLFDLLVEFATLLIQNQPPEFYRTRAIRFSAWYYANLFWGHRLQTSDIMAIRHPDEMVEIYRRYFDTHPEERVKTILTSL
jgi:nifR3 family TIM-barrel protein